MATLLDIAPATEIVEVRGAAIEVHGVSLTGLASLIYRYPQLSEMLSGQSVDVPALLQLSGDVVASIIAAGIGAPGDAASEAVAGKLPLEAQADLLSAILRVTMPGGVGPFVEKLTALASSLGMQKLAQQETLQAGAPIANGRDAAAAPSPN